MAGLVLCVCVYTYLGQLTQAILGYMKHTAYKHNNAYLHFCHHMWKFELPFLPPLFFNQMLSVYRGLVHVVF